MRVIKFRAIAISSGEFVYGNFIHSKRFAGCANEFRIHDSDTGMEWDIDISTLGQFTGLTDKNRVEIYEGDKLKIYGYKKIWETTVRFESGGFCIDVEEQPYNVTLLGFLDEESIVEIIGNIHQNKDSL
jgi:uncharacterized phage protein (TIGR01671 family)